MTIRHLILSIALLGMLAGCATQPAPAVVPQGEDRYLIDPRTGWTPLDPSLGRRLDDAWRHALAGNEAEARRQIAELLRRDPGLAPARLAEAALDLRGGRLDQARGTIEDILARYPDYIAARVYLGELEMRQGNTRAAWDAYRIAATPAAPPTVAERLAEIEERLFTELHTAAQSAPDAEAVALLRQVLEVRPSAIEPRIELAQRLLNQKQYEAARAELEPLLNVAADRAEVQEMLGEIEVSRGRFEEAIIRFERLSRRTSDPRHLRRLEEIKREWSAANMPSHFRHALSSPALTRAEFATLLYWTVPAVRFAQGLHAPPIAVDIEDVSGREEVIRAIAIGLFEVDPVTRRVSPGRPLTASRLAAHLARVLALRGAGCARGIPMSEVLATCGIENPLSIAGPDAPVTGRDAARLLEQVAGKFQ